LGGSFGPNELDFDPNDEVAVADAEFGWKRQSAENYMAVAEKFPNLQRVANGNPAQIGHGCPISETLGYAHVPPRGRNERQKITWR